MSGLTLTLGLVLLGPPPLPPEPSPDSSGDVAPPREDAGEPGGDQAAPAPPPPVRAPPQPPPEIRPVPFPLEQRRRSTTPPTGSQESPTPPKRAIIDLRDPFERPPPQPGPRGDRRRASTRMLMPDLKDPFAPELRRVRSRTLDVHVPNDIRDPFRNRPQAEGEARPRCLHTTQDGTVVQTPDGEPATRAACKPADIDLRDPFDST